MNVAPGQMIANGSYELIERVGEGGFGEVWRARDTALSADVALKFIHKVPQGSHTSQTVVEEGHKLRKLAASNHPGVANIVYANRAVVADDDETPCFMDLEWMAGGSLANMLHPGMPLQQDDIITIATQMLRALDCAHGHKMTHCDIKPSNILISEDGKTYKLGDFGLARELGDFASARAGTLPYMSPEQFSDPESISAKSDVYSLGVVLFQCARGNLPYKASSRQEYFAKHCEAPIPEIDNPTIDEPLKELISRCLRKKPDSRPKVKDLQQQLKALGDVHIASASEPRFSRLQAVQDGMLSGGSPVIRQRDIGLEFRGAGERGCYFPQRMITNQDYYKFVNEANYRRWRPGVIPLNKHDGGYLQHWFQGKPLVGDYDMPLCGVPFEAAQELASWLGGSLPLVSELLDLMSQEGGELLRQCKAYANETGLEVVQFWCRDNTLGREGDLRTMFRLMPDSSDLAYQLTTIRRPGHYCFPHYLFMVMLQPQVVDVVLERSIRPGGGGMSAGDSFSHMSQSERGQSWRDSEDMRSGGD